MEYLQPLIGGLSLLSSPVVWIYVLFGTVLGVIVGALPGIGTTLTYGLVLPFTFAMDPVNAIAFLLSISVGNQYGNSIPAILMGLPGSASAIMTTIDGYALQRRGEGGLALGVSYIAALGGQIVSIPLFVVLTVPLVQAAYLFMQPEMCALYLLGMVCIVSLTGKNVIKGLMAAGFGIGIALVGLDPMNNTPRFAFGFRAVRSGFEIVPIMIGLLAVGELFRSTRQVFQWREVSGTKISLPRFPSWRQLRPTIPSILFGTVVGTLVGAIPGAGGTPSALISYQYAQFLSKHPEEFGHGSIEGIGANEAAQNASNSGELVPTFSLGIPGSGSMVLLLGCLTAHGFIPGPQLLRTGPELFYASIGGMLASTVILIITGWKCATLMLKAVNMNRQVVTVLALATTVIGVYSLNARVFDVFVMLAAGIIGYFMLRYGYSTAGAALAVVLGAGFEANLRQGLNLVDNSWVKLLSRPITGITVTTCFVLLLYGLYRTHKARQRLLVQASSEKS
jgi:putative tricarboxylic transport membrane protein